MYLEYAGIALLLTAVNRNANRPWSTVIPYGIALSVTRAMPLHTTTCKFKHISYENLDRIVIYHMHLSTFHVDAIWCQIQELSARIVSNADFEHGRVKMTLYARHFRFIFLCKLSFRSDRHLYPNLCLSLG